MADTILDSSVGTYRYDKSKLSPRDISRLDAATDRTGKVDSDVLVKILAKYPNVFQPIAGGNGLPLPNGPLESPPTVRGISDVLAQILLKAEEDELKDLSEVKKSLTDAASIESAQAMTSAAKEKDLAIKAAESKRVAETTAATTSLASSAMQGGMSVASGAKVAGAGLATNKMKTGQQELKGLQESRVTKQKQLESLNGEWDDAPAGGIQQAQIGRKITAKRDELSQNEINIDAKTREISASEITSRERIQESQFLNQTASATGGMVSAAGNTAAAGENFASAVTNAESRYKGAEQQNRVTQRDLLNGAAQDILRVMGEVISAQGQSAQSGIDTTKNIAHNMA